MSRSCLKGFVALRVVALAGLFLYMALPGAAATLYCGEIHASPGDTGVTTSVTLAADVGDDVCGIQFDLTYDADVLSLDAVETGEAADSAGKDASFSILEEGRARVIVAGFNQNVIGDGVVAYAEFSVAGDAPDAVYPVAPTAVLLSDPWGDDISGVSISGAIIVGNPASDIPDIDGDGSWDAVDIQLVVNCALGITVPHDCDIDGDGMVNAIDIQKAINAVLGLG